MASTDDQSENAPKTYTIEASVPTGFESVAAEEAKEMFGTECRTIRGKITFEAPADRVKDILKLGGIDHCRARILHIPHFNFTEDGDDCLSRLQLLVKECDWALGMEVWQKFFSFPHPIPPTPPTIPTDEELIDVCHSIHMPGKGSGDKAARQAKKKEKKDKRKERRKGKGGGEREKGDGYRSRDDDRNRKAETSSQEKETSDKASSELNGSMPEEQAENPESSEDPSSVKEQPSTNNQSPQKVEDGVEEAEEAAEALDGSSASQPEAENHYGSADSKPAEREEEEEPPSPHKQDNAAETESSVAECKVEEKKESPPPQNSSSSPIKKTNEEEASNEPDSKVSDQIGLAEKAEGGGEATDQPESKGAGESSPPKKAKRPSDPTKPAFRVTCKRVGENHSFDSMSAAASLGSSVQTYFGWSVNMTRFNIEVMLTIDNNEVSIGLTLTPESLHRRNLVAFGVTTLRPTICHNMLRMVKIWPGHVVCDPLCGTGSISIQGALSFPAFQLCGDNHQVAMEKTHSNHSALNAKRRKADKGALMMDPVQWNACHLPLRDGLVDVFVSDMPFGKRVGRKFDNWRLYCNVLDEMARCGKITARAALLTGDINNMVKAIQGQRYWTRRRCYSCNIGGIPAAVFLLCRSPTPYTPRPHSSPTHFHHHQRPNPNQPQNPVQTQLGQGTEPEDCASSGAAEKEVGDGVDVGPEGSEAQSVPVCDYLPGVQASEEETTLD